jgi:hypothetical protein
MLSSMNFQRFTNVKQGNTHQLYMSNDQNLMQGRHNPVGMFQTIMQYGPADNLHINIGSMNIVPSQSVQ